MLTTICDQKKENSDLDLWPYKIDKHTMHSTVHLDHLYFYIPPG